MDYQASLISIFGPNFVQNIDQNEQENNWKTFLMRNCLFFYIIKNMEFLNSFSSSNNMMPGQNASPSFFHIDQNLQSFNLNNNNASMNEALIPLIQNINETLMQLFNNYQDLIQQNPALETPLFNLFNINNIESNPRNQLNVKILAFFLKIICIFKMENLENLLTGNRIESMNSNMLNSFILFMDLFLFFIVYENRSMNKEEIDQIPIIRFKANKKAAVDLKSKKIKKNEIEKDEPTCNS